MAEIYLHTLGCPKNTVDSDGLAALLRLKGLSVNTPKILKEPARADIFLINTCGFIEDAKRQSIDEILKFSAMKEKEGAKKLLVFGCMAQRYKEELQAELPEIDALWGVGNEQDIVKHIASLSNGPTKLKQPNPKQPRAKQAKAALAADPSAHAYMKIAEGCDRACTYCVIPAIRGPLKSRAPELVLGQAEALIKAGKKELVLIAQDLTRYGTDLNDGYGLSALLRDMASISGDFWIRLLYLHPASIDKQLIRTIAKEEKICNYLDLPLQHSEQSVLKRMGRGGGGGAGGKGRGTGGKGSLLRFSALISSIREAMPDVALRSTFIVGFPGETEQEFAGLRDFITRTCFDHLGVFTYSREEGTPSYSLKGHVPARIKKQRRDELMRLQSGISLKANQALVGSTQRVILEEPTVGRLASQAPEIDGVVLLKTPVKRKSSPAFVDVKITRAFDYDLEGEALL